MQHTAESKATFWKTVQLGCNICQGSILTISAQFFLKKIYVCIYLFVCICVCARAWAHKHTHVCMSQDWCGSQSAFAKFISFTIWVSRIKFRSAGLVASTFSCWAIFLALGLTCQWSSRVLKDRLEEKGSINRAERKEGQQEWPGFLTVAARSWEAWAVCSRWCAGPPETLPKSMKVNHPKETLAPPGFYSLESWAILLSHKPIDRITFGLALSKLSHIPKQWQ